MPLIPYDWCMNTATKLPEEPEVEPPSPMANAIISTYPQVSRTLHNVRIPSLRSVFSSSANMHDVIKWSLLSESNTSVKLIAASKTEATISERQLCIGYDEYVWTVDLTEHNMPAHIVLPIEFFKFEAKHHAARAIELINGTSNVASCESSFRDIHPSATAPERKAAKRVLPSGCKLRGYDGDKAVTEDLSLRLRSVMCKVTVLAIELILECDKERVLRYYERLKKKIESQSVYYRAPGLFSLPYTSESALFAQIVEGGRLMLLEPTELLNTSSVENDVLVVRALHPLDVDEQRTISADSWLPLFIMRYQKGVGEEDELPAQINYGSLSRFAVDRFLPYVLPGDPGRPFWGGTWELEDVASHFASQFVTIECDQFQNMGCVLRFPEASVPANQYFYVPYFFDRRLHEDGLDLSGMEQFQEHLEHLTQLDAKDAQKSAKKLLAPWRDVIYVQTTARAAALDYQMTLNTVELCLVCVSSISSTKRYDNVGIRASDIRFHWFAWFGCIEPNARDPNAARRLEMNGGVSEKKLKKMLDEELQMQKCKVVPRNKDGKEKVSWNSNVFVAERVYIPQSVEDVDRDERKARERRVRECTERELQQAKASADYADMERQLKERQARIAADKSRKKREREASHSVQR